CTSDASRYVITVAPLQVETALENIAHCAFNPDFSDNTLSKNFYEMQKELGAYIASPASFINESIDSKIFTDEPWKQDSGTYPPLFAKTPMEKVRSNLSFIQKTYYTPNNSAIFISGSISKENALELSKKIFNSYQKHPDVIHTKPKMNHHEKRKFIIADKSFSSDITQIVIQYTKISDINADIGANIFNAYSSSFKKNILQHQELKILGEDYIHVAATHRSGISRIIFQSLLEKSKLDAEKQAELFLSTTKKAADNIQNSEVNFIKNETISSYRSIFSSSSKIMEKLSELWALESILQETENIILSEKLNERPKKIESFSLENFCNEFNSEEPFVFVLVNSSVYQKRAKAFSSLGYELITQGNVSKEMRNLYRNASKESFQSVQNIEVDTNTSLQYIAQNKKQFEYRNLQNGIPIIFKQNFSSSTALIMISIKGGKLSTSSNHGFFSILINALAGNIQKEINKEKFNGNIKGEPSVKANTDLTSGAISVESLSEDLQNIIPCISRALIYGEVIAARADGLVYDERTQKRLRDGDSANQMYSRAIYELYAGTPYTAIFDTDTDILVHTKYTDVLESYPSLLDASRYTVILTGNFNIDKTYETLTNTIALLSSQNLKNYTPVIEQPKFPKDKKILTKLRHVFLTDKSAEEAGPRPLVLIPTTNFSDPVQYWIASPAPYQKDFALFNALANLIATRVQNKIEKIFLDSSLKFDYATSAIQAVCITFTKIEKVKQLDQIYEQVL
ncbi:MAG: insulinase family protein, partial [Treponema sp.]|nr:insulinase family protein [Treponema sp.]